MVDRLPSASTVIRTLRIKTAMSDQLAARQQTERALQAASLRPIGLPRDVILIVRHFTARQPGMAGWEQAVNAELDQIARQAAHPIEGAVPANAAAVIFADRSELLACLTADWCAGVVRSQWWWQSWLRGEDATRAVIEAWLATPEYIPLALQHLSARRQAIAFVQRLSDTHTRSLLRALLQTFGLYQLSLALDEINAMEATDRATITPLPVAAQPTPWQPWVQAHIEHLSIDRQVLLGVGLMLPVAPNVVRSASFASEVKAWHATIHTTAQSTAPNASLPTVVPPTTAESITTTLVQEPMSTSTVQPQEPQPVSLRGGREPAKQSPPEQYTAPIVGESAAPPSTTPQEAVAPLETLDVPEITSTQISIETEFGGVCYFINLGLFLNLYGDFTSPLQPGLDLPIWDFVALVAQDLLGDEVTRDPIWLLLAQLAARAVDEPPGTHFDPMSYALHPERSRLVAQSKDAIHEKMTLQSWLADLMSIIRPRLQLALGVNNDDLPRYFKHHARLMVNELNFDAYFALAELPIEIRLSGLDRDPGWVPAAGRTVRFHYD